ncbi:ABC transporter permease [Microbacterium sp. Marseille-Q6965]|uniref:ABC transporter permease n=1 Tax=Microbacterium sp. Marseille-Q6965 TaxID=2965072 RepID=UPI0021B76020|nr:ABC transporter permease [Microbacterium sp. Marseille-Q6965]
MNALSTAPAAATTARRAELLRKMFYWWDRVGILGVLILLIVIASFASENFLSFSNAMDVLRAISINAIIAAGVTVVILTAGIDLSVGSILAVAGCVGVLLHVSGMPAPVAVVGGIVAGALAGALNGVLVALLVLPSFIVTLGSMQYLRGTAYALLDGQPLIANDLSYAPLGSSYVSVVPTPVVIMLIVYVIMWFVLERTTFGRHVYAVGGNPEAARLAGINVKKVLLWVYTIGGATAGLGGILFSARVLSAQPNAGQSYELDAIAAVVLGGTALAGGRGRIFGTLLGAMIIGVLSNILVLTNVPYFYQLIIKGLVIVLAITLDSLRRVGQSR